MKNGWIPFKTFGFPFTANQEVLRDVEKLPLGAGVRVRACKLVGRFSHCRKSVYFGHTV